MTYVGCCDVTCCRFLLFAVFFVCVVDPVFLRAAIGGLELSFLNSICMMLCLFCSALTIFNMRFMILFSGKLYCTYTHTRRTFYCS